MEVKRIQYANNNSYKPNFEAVKQTNYLGGFAWDYTKSAQAVFDAFESSRVLKVFCDKNDVNVSFIISPMGNCCKAATLKIEKIFNNPTGFLNGIKNLFNKKEKQIIYINAFGNNNTESKEKLVEKIKTLEIMEDLTECWKHPFDEFNGIYKLKPKWAR